MGNLVTNSINTKLYGYRIYKIIDKGPLSMKNINPIEDFIIPPEGVDKKIEFSKFLQKNKQKEIEISIYSTKSKSFRKVNIIPDDSWTENKEDGFIGAQVKYENWSCAHKNVLRFVSISPGSIIEKAGIVKNDDFLIGVKKEENDVLSLNQEEMNPLDFFRRVIEECHGQEVEFILFNIHTGYRSVKICLKYDKSQSFGLGCELAYGSFHQIPNDN